MAEIQNISTQQRLNLNNSVVKKTLSFDFGLPQDYIELHIFNQNDQLLSSVNNFTNFTQPTPKEINMDPVQVLNTNGYLLGKYKLVFNIQRKKIFNTLSKIFTLKEISPSRTELRAIAGNINNPEFDNAVQGFINEIESSISFVDFILNFGQNQNIPSVNLILNKNPNKHEILIKLAQPLPNQLSLNNNFNIVTDISDSIIIDVDLGGIDFIDDSVNLKGPNFKIDVRLNNSVPSSYKNYDEILEYTLTSSYQNLLNQLEKKEVPNIIYDYIPPVSSSDEAIIDKTTYHFDNFIHFGSALERLKNFEYKIQLIESYDSQILEFDSITGGTSSIYIRSNKQTIKNKKNNLIKSFDGYERFLYYDSGSFASWPKSNNISPYTLYSVSSSQVINWIGNENDSFPNYGGQLLSASLFDRQNKNNLTKLVPNHIIENSDNSFYTSFVNMVGQHFDQTWLYIKHITEVNNTDNLKGVSKELVYLSLKSLGLETFDQFENANLVEYILGEGTTGSMFYDIPVSQSLITASNAGSIPKGDITKEIWKRLYHNAPYLLKTKGTERGLRALMSCYGIPSTILDIKEYGGSTKDKTTYKTFTYENSSLALNGDSGTDGFFIKTDWSSSLTHPLSSSAKTVEFRIKPHRSNNTYHLWSLSGSFNSPTFDSARDQHIILEPYTGNDISSSGDANQYGRLTFSTNRNDETKSTQYFPIYNGDFWNIFVGVDATGKEDADNLNVKFGAYQANYNKNIFSYTASYNNKNKTNNSFTWGVTPSAGSQNATFIAKAKGATYCYIGGLPSGIAEDEIDGLRYSGSLQELRYHFGELLSHETLIKHALEPFMYSGNTPSSSYENVVLRLPLGSNDQRDSGSFHPNIDVDYFNINNPELLDPRDVYLYTGPDADSNTSFINLSNYSNPEFNFITHTTGNTLISANFLSSDNDTSTRLVIGRSYQFNYTVLSSNKSTGLAIYQRTNDEHPLISQNGSSNQITLNTNVGNHSVIFSAAETFFAIKRIVSGMDVTITNLSLIEEPGLKSSMLTQKWEENIETHFLPTPDTVGKSMTSEKVRIDEGSIDDNILLVNHKLETSTLDRQPLDYPDLGVFFSPTSEINKDIIYTLGSFRLDDYIGSPLPSDQTSSIYNNLSEIKNIYFKKVKNKYNYWDYIKLIQYIDHTLFKLIEQWVPAKTNLKTGLVIEPHYLERNKVKRSLPVVEVGQSMKSNSHQTFEFDLYPNKSFSLDNSSVITSNNLLQTTGSNQQRQEQGTNFTIDMNDYVTFEVGFAAESNIMNGRPSNRYYTLLDN